MIRSVADFSQGLAFARFIPLNDDLTIPLKTSVNAKGRNALIGGAGPFDFSDVESDGAVVIYAKVDAGNVQTKYVDLSTGVSSLSAVTVDELVTRLTAASITGATFTKEVATGRLKCVFSTGNYHQLYGQCAEIAGFGQGFGVKIIKSNTIKSISDTPVAKESQNFTTTDANNIDTEVVTDGYRKGFSSNVVDTADDKELRALIEGGVYDSVTGKYETPNSGSSKKYFMIEAYYKRYGEGSNKEADLKGYTQKIFLSCKGAPGDRSHEAGFADMPYKIDGFSYKDENGVLSGDQIIQDLTKVQYLALDLLNV